jgi:hypothetical protein
MGERCYATKFINWINPYPDTKDLLKDEKQVGKAKEVYYILSVYSHSMYWGGVIVYIVCITLREKVCHLSHLSLA